MKAVIPILSFTILILSGCANPGIVQISQDTYMLAKADRGGIFGNTAKLKADVHQEAQDFAASMGMIAIPVTSKETPMLPGRFATYEYQFKLVPKDAPEAKGAHLVPRADLVIEKTENIDAKIETNEHKQSDTYTELLKLNDLKEKGILTEEEFQSEKAKLLSN